MESSRSDIPSTRPTTTPLAPRRLVTARWDTVINAFSILSSLRLEYAYYPGAANWICSTMLLKGNTYRIFIHPILPGFHRHWRHYDHPGVLTSRATRSFNLQSPKVRTAYGCTVRRIKHWFPPSCLCHSSNPLSCSAKRMCTGRYKTL